MFARILKSKKKYGIYEYLVISESTRSSNGKSTTRNIANLGNINNFDRRKVKNIIKGLARIFEIEDYTATEEVKISEVLEHGNILLWRKIWNQLGLSRIIDQQSHQTESRIKLDVVKYIEMMVVNRCISPLSKLATSRWIEGTSYKIMKDYHLLKRDVEYFYRSMDYLLKAKDQIEFAIYQKLRNLFSINVKLTFYDITSTYFYSDSCSITAKGYSRDGRSELEQVVIGVVTSYEGYPIKHYVFTGNTKDETTVAEVVGSLKKEYNIQETVFVGDRGMITKLNLQEILDKNYDYIMGVKQKQEEQAQIFFSDNKLFDENTIIYNDLKIVDKNLAVKDFIIWKISMILDDNNISFAPRDIDPLSQKILALNNKNTKIFYKDFKIDIEKLLGTENKKLCRKIFGIIKKQEGKYENYTRFIICLNENRKRIFQKKRRQKLKAFEDKIKQISDKDKNAEKKLNQIFEGYNRQYKKFFIFSKITENETIKYRLNAKTLEYEERFDGVFIITSNRYDLTPVEIIKSYKNLQEVETLFEDLKQFVDVRPVRHWLRERVEAHIFICILALLLKRVFEIEYLKNKSVMEPLEEIGKSKVIRLKVPKIGQPEAYTEFPKITELTAKQKKYFNMVGIKNPMDLGNYMW